MVGSGLTVVSVTSGAGREPVDGTVVELVGEDMTSPVVEYQVEGVSCRVQGGVASSPSAHELGDQVTVLYEKELPGEGHIDTFIERWLLPIVAAVAGFNLLLLSLALPWVQRLFAR